MSNGFEAFFKRLCSETEIKNQSQLARELDVGRAAVSLAKRKDSVPARWILDLSARFGLNPLWLEQGKGFPRPEGRPGGSRRGRRVLRGNPQGARPALRGRRLVRDRGSGGRVLFFPLRLADPPGQPGQHGPHGGHRQFHGTGDQGRGHGPHRPVPHRRPVRRHLCRGRGGHGHGQARGAPPPAPWCSGATTWTIPPSICLETSSTTCASSARSCGRRANTASPLPHAETGPRSVSRCGGLFVSIRNY